MNTDANVILAHRTGNMAPEFCASSNLEEVLRKLPAVLYQCGPPPDFPTTFISENVLSHLGYSSQEFYSDPYFWTKQIHPNERNRILQALATIGDKDAIDYEYRFRRIDGEYCWFHDQLSVVRNEKNEIVGLIGSWFDISLRRQLELFQAGQAQVLDSLVKHRSLEETLTQIVCVMEEQNPAMVGSILLFDPATQSVRHGAAPNLPEEYKRQVDGLVIGPATGSCGTALYRRERVIVTDIETSPLWENYRELVRKIGMRACWSQPIISSSSQLLGTFAMYYNKARGPTAIELELIEQAARLAALAIEQYHDEEKMRHSERLVSLGTLAAGIAHEINNPIGGIQLAVQCLRKAWKQGQQERIAEMIDLIASDAERCTRIVHGVLQFGRRNDGQKVPVDLCATITAVMQLTRGYASERRANVAPGLGDEPALVMGSAPELVQVFVNLVRNAIESKDHGVNVAIRIGMDRDFVRVTVSDDGRGMTESQQKQIFDPFFTTRQREGGTGLGMSIVHGIVSGHGGTISVRSKPGKGTSVVVCLLRQV